MISAVVPAEAPFFLGVIKSAHSAQLVPFQYSVKAGLAIPEPLQPPVERADSVEPPPIASCRLSFISPTSDQFVPFHSSVSVQKALLGAYLPPNLRAECLLEPADVPPKEPTFILLPEDQASNVLPILPV